jgi:hypothetical protein
LVFVRFTHSSAVLFILPSPAFAELYDPYLRKTGKRVPAREKAHHNRIRWWEVVILLGVLSVEEYEYNLLGLRHWVQDEVDRWR